MVIKTVMVVGAGLMGSGISQVAAQAGYNVVMNDVKNELVEKGLNAITKNLDSQIKKEKITTTDKGSILSRISKSVSIDDAKKVDFVIEAAFENFEVKKIIFASSDE